MSCHLGVCRAIIDGLPRWCVDRTLERRSVLLSVPLSARFSGYLSACSLYQLKKSNHLLHSAFMVGVLS